MQGGDFVTEKVRGLELSVLGVVDGLHQSEKSGQVSGRRTAAPMSAALGEGVSTGSRTNWSLGRFVGLSRSGEWRQAA